MYIVDPLILSYFLSLENGFLLDQKRKLFTTNKKDRININSVLTIKINYHSSLKGTTNISTVIIFIT